MSDRQTQPAAAPDPTFPQGYSRAFETFVEDPHDLIGLIAYALYKQAVREAMRANRPVLPPGHRHPTATELAAYRGDAEQRLQTFGASLVEEATPDIMEQGAARAIRAASADIVATVNRRTSFGAALLVNLTAWVITLAVTALLVLTIYLPNWPADLVERLRNLTGR